jgi:hypothetical protein
MNVKSYLTKSDKKTTGWGLSLPNNCLLEVGLVAYEDSIIHIPLVDIEVGNLLLDLHDHWLKAQ